MSKRLVSIVEVNIHGQINNKNYRFQTRFRVALNNRNRNEIEIRITHF